MMRTAITDLIVCHCFSNGFQKKDDVQFRESLPTKMEKLCNEKFVVKVSKKQSGLSKVFICTKKEQN